MKEELSFRKYIKFYGQYRIIFLDIIDGEWSSKLEWYLHEFLQLSKGNVQGSPDRPARDSERQKVK